MKGSAKRIVSFLTLFSSVGTLVCCALPALFVSLGAGAVFAGLVSNFPQLIWLSRYKMEIFIFAAVMLIVSGLLRYLSRSNQCPVDGDLAEACFEAKNASDWIFPLSLICFFIGGFFAFVAPRLI